MNNWFQFNKKSIITGGVGLVIFLGIAGLGVSYYLEEGETYAKIKSAESDVSNMAGKKHPPTEQVRQQIDALAEQYNAKMVDISKQYDGFRQSSVLRHVDAQSFQNSLKAESQAWNETCKQKKITVAPDAVWMGFGSYRVSAPISRASTLLSFQKEGIINLLNIITNNGAVKFTKVFRPALPIETPPSANEDGRGSNAARDLEEEPEWQYMPFEVTFTGDRASVAKILNEMSKSDKFLYVFSGLRVKNEKDKPVTFAAPKAETANAATNAGIALNVGPSVTTGPAVATPAEPAAPVSEEILKKVLGEENVIVHMAVNLVYFPPRQQDGDSAEAAPADQAGDDVPETGEADEPAPQGGPTE